MIEMRLDGNDLIVSFDKVGGAFKSIVDICKKNKGKFNPQDKSWEFTPMQYSPLFDSLSEYGIIEDKVDKDALDKACWGEPKKFVEKQRRIPDWSLLRFPPLLGKEPNENFQKQAISMGINVSCRYYGFGCGSGKSYIASGIIAHRYGKYHDCNKVLFVTTTIGVKNLYYELEKFIVGLDMSRVVIADKNNRMPFTDDVDIVICSYGTMRLIGNAYKEKMKLRSKTPKKPYLPIKEWCNGGEAMLILDESHSASNHKAQQTQVLLVNSTLFKYRYLFSGTPADKPEKLYAQYEILDPYLNSNMSYTNWLNYYAKLGDYFSEYSINGWKEDKLKELNERFTNGYGIYLETTDLIDLPENYERRVYIDLSSKHKKLYQDIVMGDIRNGTFKTKDIVNRFPYMQLALDCPELLKEHVDKFNEDTQELIKNFKSTIELEKVEAIDEILEEHEYGKCIIWCIHPKTIAMLGERYAKYNPICVDGSIPQEERFSLVEKFKKSKNNSLLIANVLALNTSITVTEAKYQIYVERPYSYASYEQSTRRIWRNGQKERVETYYLIYTNSIDVLLDKNLESKGLLVEGLQAKGFLSKENWKKIFNAEPNMDFDDLESKRDMGNFGWFGKK